MAWLENVQYKAGKIVTGAYHYTSKDNLNKELGWETIKDRGDLLSLNIFHKIHQHETRPHVRTCMPKLDFKRTCGTNFPRINKKLKLDLILRGVNIDDEDFYHTNNILTTAVQNFIISTKRFASI